MRGTTLKLPDELKARILPLARRAGKTPHAFMVDALRAEAERAELRERFLDEAVEAAAEVDAGGPVYAMAQVHEYVRTRLQRKKTKLPTPLKGGTRRP